MDVVTVPPKPTMLFMDEMAHVVSKATEPASGRARPLGVRGELATATALVVSERSA